MARCFVCNHEGLDESSLLRGIDRRKGLQGSWSIGKCSYCEIETIFPRPTEEELNSFYERYYGGGSFTFQKMNLPGLAWLRKIYHLFTGDVDPRDFIRPASDAKILDYGCGGASYIQHFHRKGYAISGADVSAEVVTQSNLNGMNVKKVDDFNEIPFPTEQFDIVYLMQVFEHLRDPNTFFMELNRVLVDGGELYVSVPNANSIWRMVFGRHWVSGYFAPFHLAHYNEGNFTWLASNHGFKVEKTFYKTPESWFRLNVKALLHSDVNELDAYRSWLDSKIVKLLLTALLRLVELPVKNRDCMTVHLTKVGAR